MNLDELIKKMQGLTDATELYTTCKADAIEYLQQLREIKALMYIDRTPVAKLMLINGILTKKENENA